MTFKSSLPWFICHYIEAVFAGRPTNRLRTRLRRVSGLDLTSNGIRIPRNISAQYGAHLMTKSFFVSKSYPQFTRTKKVSPTFRFAEYCDLMVYLNSLSEGPLFAFVGS